MGDLIASLLDRLSLILGVPPWITVLTLVFAIVVIIGVGFVLRNRRAGGDPDWQRDPDEMEDLSPRLRQARLQMIAAAIAMAAIFAIAILSFFES